MLLSLESYIETMNDTEGLTRTLGVVDVCRNADGSPAFIVGNNSVLFTIRHEGRLKMLKCYTRPKPDLRAIYGDACLHDELFVFSDDRRGEWVDVVLTDRIEGVTLRRAIASSRRDSAAMAALAAEFDRLALRLLDERWAHGDLKPENIIVDAAGGMHLIDFDAVWLPEFAGRSGSETGTAAFQHPKRTAELFDKSIDDYPAALISTALHALAADPALGDRFGTDDILVIDPHEAVGGTSRALNEILTLFGSRCMAVEYRIAELLRSRVPRLGPLRRLLGYAVGGCASTVAGTPVLVEEEGLWGYRSGDGYAVPPLYDEGFELRGGMCAVRLGRFDHALHIVNGRVTVADNPPATETDGAKKETNLKIREK